MQLRPIGSPMTPTNIVIKKPASTTNVGGLGGLTTAPKAPTTTLGGAAATPTTPVANTGIGTIDPNVLGNYQNEILGSPMGQSATGIYSAQSGLLASQRADAIQRAIISAGYSPQLTGSLASYAGDVTPDTLTAAAANPMSQKAQLDLQLSQANQNMPYDLAASGAGRSGAAAIQQGNLQRQYQTSTYQNEQNLLNAIYGAANTYTGGIANAQSAYQNSLAYAGNLLAQMPGYSASIDPSAAASTLAPAAPPVAGYTPSIPAETPTQQAVGRAIAAVSKPTASTPNLALAIHSLSRARL